MAKGKYQEWLKPENLILIQGWRRDGLSDADIAKKIGIRRETIYAWLKSYPNFANAYKKGSEVSTYEVENALYKSALGYDVTEVEQVETTNPDGSVTVQKRQRRRHIQANIAAQIFILKNRRSEWWKDTKTIENKSDGMLADLINGLKEPLEDDIHEKTENGNEPVAEEQAQKD